MNILWINKITDAEYWRTTQLGLTAALRKRGHNVMLVMTRHIGDYSRTDESIVYLPTLPSSLLSGLFFGLLLTFYFPLFIRKNKPDVIIIDGTSVWLPFVLTFKLLNIPLVLDIRTLPIQKTRAVAFDFCLHLSKYVTDGLTTITPELEDILRKKYGLKGSIGIWPSGVSLEDFSITSLQKESFNPTYSQSFVVMHHGSHGNSRGMEEAIQAMGVLDDSLKNKIKLVLIGIREKNQEALLRICREAGVTDQVAILPRVAYEQIPSYIAQSDIGIIPLPPEKEWWRVSVPLKTLEYMAMGKPVIATNIPFHQRLFEKGECGILVHASNPEIFAHAITELYHSRKHFDEMAKIARDIIETHYTWDSIATDVEKYLSTIVRNFRT